MDVTTAQQYLADAEAARQRLLTGALEVEISGPDGRRVAYALPQIAALERYIALLQSLVMPRRPIGFRFGR